MSNRMQPTPKQDATNFASTINSLNIEIISFMQKDIDTYDLISLVFLLYDEPHTALQRLTLFQRVSRDITGTECNLLLDWAMHAQSRSSWRQELLEAFVTCQLFSVIRKLGFHVPSVREQFTSEATNFINPVKKILYKLCENLNAENLNKLRKTLKTYDIDTSEYESCELILLDLMCRKFITLNPASSSKSGKSIENLTKIIENFSDLKEFTKEMRKIEDNNGNIPKLNNDIVSSLNVNKSSKENDNQKYIKDFDDAFDLFNQLSLEEEKIMTLKSDKKLQLDDVYEIKNPKNIGICYIINQEKFHPSKHSIKNDMNIQLEDRHGSLKDKEALERTMSALNFEVITSDNLDHSAMLEQIRNILINRVCEEHSMFMLCILSHGTKGYVYAADSVKVKVTDIEHLFDLDESPHLRNKPKLLILQACQVRNSVTHTRTPLVADSAKTSFQYYIKKADVIIYWATAPDYEAYRHEEMGSIFIQLLCKAIQDHYKNEHVLDLFTKVNNNVKKVCTKLRCEQLPRVEHTLLKKIYFFCSKQS